jgi:hypothetical protein
VYCTRPVSTVTNQKKLLHSSSLHLYPSISIKRRHWVSLSTFPVPCAVRANRIRFKYYVCVMVCQFRNLACPMLRRVSRSDKRQAQVHVWSRPSHRSRDGIRLQGLSKSSLQCLLTTTTRLRSVLVVSPLGPVLGIPRCASKILKFLTLCIVVTAYTL